MPCKEEEDEVNCRQLAHLQYIKEEQLDALRPQFTEVAKMLSGLRNSLTVRSAMPLGSSKNL